MPTTLPLRIEPSRTSPEPAVILLCLALWVISLVVIFAEPGGAGDLVAAVSIEEP